MLKTCVETQKIIVAQQISQKERYTYEMEILKVGLLHYIISESSSMLSKYQESLSINHIPPPHFNVHYLFLTIGHVTLQI